MVGVRVATGLLICAFLGSTRVVGDVVTLAPTKDNTLYQSASGSISNGSGSFIFAGRTGQANNASRRRAILSFEIAGNILPGSIIESVSLRMHMSRTRFSTSRLHELHALLAEWGEGSSNDTGPEGGGTLATPGDATWLHTFFDTDFWASSGGDFSPTVSASASVGGIGFYSWSSTPQLVADVQGWLDVPSSNFGWVILGDESASRTAKRFDSRENFNTSFRPMLTVEFTATLGACCQMDGSCFLLSEAECTLDGGKFQGLGIPCDDDPDDDAVTVCADNCPLDSNVDQADWDWDGLGDVCDNCPQDDNIDQADGDADDVGDICDNCPQDANVDQSDADEDGVGDICDPCPADNPDDTDRDGVCDSNDRCPGSDDRDDADDDGQPDGCDPCPLDRPDDSDRDGICDSDDLCPGEDDTIDIDNNGLADCAQFFAIPTTSTWGLLALALLLATWAKVIFTRLRSSVP